MGNLLGCLWEKKEKQEPLKTEVIYSLIFKDAHKNDEERSLSDSIVSYKISYSPESDLR